MQKTTYSPEFKAKVVLEVIQGDRELGEIAAEHNLNPVKWEPLFWPVGNRWSIITDSPIVKPATHRRCGKGLTSMEESAV